MAQGEGGAGRQENGFVSNGCTLRNTVEGRGLSVLLLHLTFGPPVFVTGALVSVGDEHDILHQS